MADMLHVPLSLSTLNILHPTPYTLHPTPHTLHPTRYTVHPTPPLERQHGRPAPCTSLSLSLSLSLPLVPNKVDAVRRELRAPGTSLSLARAFHLSYPTRWVLCGVAHRRCCLRCLPAPLDCQPGYLDRDVWAAESVNASTIKLPRSGDAYVLPRSGARREPCLSPCCRRARTAPLNPERER